MADQIGEIFLPANSQILLDQFLRDLRLAAEDAGVDQPPIQPGSDWHKLGVAISNISLIGLQNGAIGLDNTNVLNATGDALDALREAYGVPEAPEAGATGKIVPDIQGSTTIAEGKKFTLPNGQEGEVVGDFVDPPNGTEIDVRMLDTGTDTNLGGGETVTFRSPPTNVAEEALVSESSPLVDGVDEENDERKRLRILNKLGNSPGAGNWAQSRATVLNADASIQDTFVYPALGGPSSVKVVPIRAIDPAQKIFTRAVTAGQIQNAKDAIFAEYPTAEEVVTQAAVDQLVDFTWKIQIPDSALSGGNGEGWIDQAPWPPMIAGDSGTITITAVSNGGATITIDAATTTAPVDLQTNVAWWSAVDRRFYQSLVESSSGATTAWVLNLQTPFVDSNGDVPAVGEYVSPAAKNMEDYGDSWLIQFNTLGPGENTSDTDRTPRALRHPFVQDERPADWSDLLFCNVQDDNPEITDAARQFASATATTVPASVDTGPSILTPQHFGLYQL